MVTFNFSFNPPKKKREPPKKEVILVKQATGIVVNDENGFTKCNYQGNLYTFTLKSFDTYKKKNVYMRKRDKFGHRIKIIRDKDKRCKMHRKFYSALSTGLIVKGKIIKTVDDLVLFDVISSYNPADVVEMAEAIKEFNKYNNNDKLEVNFDW